MVNKKNNRSKAVGELNITLDLSPGIHDITDGIKSFLLKKEPLEKKYQQAIKLFRHSNAPLDPNLGFDQKDEALKALKAAQEHFNLSEAKEALKEGMSLAQKIDPQTTIEEFPVIFLFHRYGDASALFGQGCAININALRENPYTDSTSYEKLLSLIAHESTHCFLKQLDLNKSMLTREKDTFKKDILHHIWEEGLATYIQPNHYRHHYALKKEAPLWIEFINNWFEAKDDQTKISLLKDVVKWTSFKTLFEDMYKEKPITDVDNFVKDKNLNSLFSYLLLGRNGVAYHVGAYLWEKEIEAGNDLSELVKQGDKNIIRWLEKSLLKRADAHT